jgi:hypothetical protein
MAQPPDVFDQVFDLLTPARLLHDQRANGQGVRVCLIDTGVDRQLLARRALDRGQPLEPIEGGVFRADREEPLPDHLRQSAPHGTTVADIILTLAPRVRLFSADVFGSQGFCDVEAVIHALRWAVHHWACKVINLSLGVPEDRLAQAAPRLRFLRAVEEAYYKDVIVFAAAHNDHPLTRSYPALFAPPLLSVDKQLFGDPLQFAYRLHHQVEFQAHGRGYLGPFASEPATSWAAPHLAGIAARLLTLRPDLKPFEFKTLLYWMFVGSSRGAAK